MPPPSPSSTAKGPLGEQEKEDLKRCRGEWKALKNQRETRGRIESLTGLSGVGLLPNYNLLDDSTSLDVHLWWPTDDASSGDRSSEALDLTYDRASRAALKELAPGAYFYADGKRVEIDAVDVGPAGQPAWRTWRLCPTCGWGTDELGAPVGSCPRCGGAGVGDAGALHKILPLRRVSAVHRLDDAVIDEDDDERSRTFFTTVTGVDIARYCTETRCAPGPPGAPAGLGRVGPPTGGVTPRRQVKWLLRPAFEQ